MTSRKKPLCMLPVSPQLLLSMPRLVHGACNALNALVALTLLSAASTDKQPPKLQPGRYVGSPAKPCMSLFCKVFVNCSRSSTQI